VHEDCHSLGGIWIRYILNMSQLFSCFVCTLRSLYIVTCRWLDTGFGLIIGFIVALLLIHILDFHLQYTLSLIFASQCWATDPLLSHTLHSSLEHTASSQFAIASCSHCLVAALTNMEIHAHWAVTTQRTMQTCHSMLSCHIWFCVTKTVHCGLRGFHVVAGKYLKANHDLHYS
jgi:hypothetical protein